MAHNMVGQQLSLDERLMQQNRDSMKPKMLVCDNLSLAGVVLCTLVALSACGGSGSAGSGSSEQPVSLPTTPVLVQTPAAAAGKVFALMDPGESSSSMQTYAAMAGVDGLAYRSLWSSVEPQAGVYNWTNLDAALDAASAKNKKITLHVGMTAQAAPAWLASLGVGYFSANSPIGPVSGPIPWDSTYLQRVKSLVAAMASHIDSRGSTGLVEAVSDGAPTAEMSLAGCQNNMLGNTPYSRNSYLNAWQTTVSAYAQSFPKTRLLISAPVQVICGNDNDGQAFYLDVMNYALNHAASVGVFAADLNASGTGSQRMSQVDTSIKDQAGIFFQTIWSYTNDAGNRMQGSLDAAVCKGWSLNGRYFEVYKADLNNAASDVQAAIARARTGPGC